MFGFVAELSIQRDCAVIEREDAVHLGGAPVWDFCRGLCREIEQRVSLCLWEDFGGV